MTDIRMHRVGAVLAVGLAVLVALADREATPTSSAGLDAGAFADVAWAEAVETGADHIGTRALGDLLLATEKGGPMPLFIDVRPPAEFEALHLVGAANLSLPELLGDAGAALLADAAGRTKVLYSNGPAHPAQAWTALRARGVEDVWVLDGGLDQFVADELLPPSLRPVPSQASVAAHTARAATLRRLALGAPAVVPGCYATDPPVLTRPTLVSTAWLANNLGRVVVVDTRGKAEDYLEGHIEGARHAPIEMVRETRDGVGDELLRVPALATTVGALGIDADTAVVAYSQRMHDAAHFALALLRLGHRRVAILEGGLPAWVAEKRPLSTEVVRPDAKTYVPWQRVDDFTATLDDVKQASATGSASVLDTRPADQFAGKEATEARGGHIPGALNRPLAADTVTDERGVFLRPLADLRREYGAMGLRADQPVIVACRTGHQAAQTWFVLRYLLGHRDVRWYDGSWKEWAAHAELPLEKSVEGH
ncbi:MAG: rhodanese-like domain-containing protein [Planctomycetota bacterium]